MGDIDELTKDTVNAYLAEKGDTLEAYNFTTKYPTEGGWRTHDRYEIIKAMFFGGIIALVACNEGMHAKSGAEGVGQATTKSVVTSIIFIFICNYILSVLLY